MFLIAKSYSKKLPHAWWVHLHSELQYQELQCSMEQVLSQQLIDEKIENKDTKLDHTLKENY